MATIQFDTSAAEGKRAIVVSFDLSGFSNFCNHPEAYAILPKFIGAIFNELDSVFIDSFQELWDGLDPQNGKAPVPDFIKYTGDGALIIWFPPVDTSARQRCCTAIVAAMKRFRQRLLEIVPKWEIEWQIDHLPKSARVGIATGLVYPLKPKSMISELLEPIDYAGYCINLAVRLQDHCPEIGFLIHELVFPQLPGLMKYIAHGMRGAQKEPVLMFVSDVPPLTLGYIESKFQPSGVESELRHQVTQRESNLGTGKEGAPIVAQPRFKAQFIGGPYNGMVAFLPQSSDYFYPVLENKDANGRVLERKKLVYQRISQGPPIVYQYMRTEDMD